MNYILTTKTENELYHTGVKGMKWGVIRWKNKQYDKKLTKQKEKAKLIKEKEKLKAKKEKLDSLKNNNATRKENLKAKSSTTIDNDSAPRQKTVKELSDTELKNRVNRMQLEQTYLNMSPKQTSKGRAFVKRVSQSVLIPAAEDIGRQIVKSLLTKGVNHFVENDELKVYTNNKKK